MELPLSVVKKIADYSVPSTTLDSIRSAPLLFVVSITAGGKNTIVQYLLSNYGDKYRFIVSHTTRSMRENSGVMEQEGVEYHFVSTTEVERMLDAGEFIEAKVIHSDTIYGTSVAEIKQAHDAGVIAITDLDVQGVDEYMALDMQAKAVFLLPPSYEIWKQRLVARSATMDTEALKHRLQSALHEIEHALHTDYYYIVINDDVARTAELTNDITHGVPVEPHYHKAVVIAEDMVNRIRAELRQIETPTR